MIRVGRAIPSPIREADDVSLPGGGESREGHPAAP